VVVAYLIEPASQPASKRNNSTSPIVADRIFQLRRERPGKAFFIADSDHTKAHVLGELMQLRKVTLPGDYVVIEDGIVNGNPVLPGWGEGPLEALQEYFAKYPNDYVRDTGSEELFGFTFAPKGFLVRQQVFHQRGRMRPPSLSCSAELERKKRLE
jgi:cephalosporin hydroxylase